VQKDFINLKIVQNHSYSDQYDPDKSHVMYVFDVPEIIKEDFIKKVNILKLVLL
jgi:hypothetical protein